MITTATLDIKSIEQELLTEGWLRAVCFKWHQLDRQPTKQWLLWLGGAIVEARTALKN